MDSGFATLRHDKEHIGVDDLGATLSSQKETSSRRKSVQFGPRDQTEPDEHMYDLSKYLKKDVKRSDGSDKLQTKVIDKNVTVHKNRGQSQNEQNESNRAAAQSGSSTKLVHKIKPATYDGSTSWLDYKSHFEACAKLGQWTEEEKGLYLSVSLRGHTQGVLGNLHESEQLNYAELIRALNDRFAPPDQMELYRLQLREKRQKASETLPELGQNIRRLTNLAYPTVPADVRKTLAKDCFVDSLASSDLRLKIKQARPLNLNDAVRHAVELEANFKAESNRMDASSYVNSFDSGEHQSASSCIDVQKLVNALATLQKSVEKIEAEMKSIKLKPPATKSDSSAPQTLDNSSWKKNVKCHFCGRKGHIKRDCRFKKAHDKEYGSSKTKSSPGGQSKQIQTKDQIGVSGYQGSSGLFVEFKLGSFSINLLIDTGASLSIISKGIFNQLSGVHNVDPMTRPVIKANDEPLTVYGKTKVSMCIGQTHIRCQWSSPR